jgi:hypothetical protein
LTPQVVTPEAFEMLDLVKRRRPLWGGNLSLAMNGWGAGARKQEELMKDLEPVRERMKWIWLIYPAGSEAMGRAGDLIRQVTAGTAVKNAVDPMVALGELVRHVFLELWLENDRKLEGLYNACGNVFAENGFEQQLERAYFLRLGAFEEVPNPLLLSNSSLLPLISNFAPRIEDEQVKDAMTKEEDVAAFEIFRRIISPRLDPLTKPSIQTVAEILASREDELAALKKQCVLLAEELRGTSRENLEPAVEKLVERHVADELAAVLRLSERAKQDFLAEIMADKVTWVSLFSAVAGAEIAVSELTTAGGIGVVATILAKGVDAGWQFHKEIRDNPYRLIRRLPT